MANTPYIELASVNSTDYYLWAKGISSDLLDLEKIELQHNGGFTGGTTNFSEPLQFEVTGTYTP